MKLVLLLAAAFLSAFAVSDPIIPLKASTMLGRWMLDGNVRAVRFDLKPNGTFEYIGYGSKSKGRWNVEGDHLRLRWTHIDSGPVDSAKVTGAFPVVDGTLQVGKFGYRKA